MRATHTHHNVSKKNTQLRRGSFPINPTPRYLYQLAFFPTEKRFLLPFLRYCRIPLPRIVCIPDQDTRVSLRRLRLRPMPRPRHLPRSLDWMNIFVRSGCYPVKMHTPRYLSSDGPVPPGRYASTCPSQRQRPPRTRRGRARRGRHGPPSRCPQNAARHRRLGCRCPRSNWQDISMQDRETRRD
jgi:hypothetical protein